MKPRKVCIGIPNTGTILAETVISLFPNLFIAIEYIQRTHKVGLLYDMIAPAGCYVHLNRNICAERALEVDADYLFFVDSDMEFPENSLAKLLYIDKDIVGATYNKRTFPVRPILDRPKEDLPPYPFQINALPTGLLLIKTEVFKKMEKPWFAFTFTEGENKWQGEDVYFCHKATGMGFQIWCDPTIDVKHIGNYKF